MTSEVDKLDTPLPIWMILYLPIHSFLFFGLTEMLIAGDWKWFEAWLFGGTMAIVMTISASILNKLNPRVLRNRMRSRKEGITKKTEKTAGTDKYILPLLGISGIGAFYLPAFSHRLNWAWDSIPLYAEILGLVICVSGMIIIFISLHQNAYASKILDINKEQKIIDTGIYGKIRHPVYTGYATLFLGTPIVLGSWVSVSFSILSLIILVIRIKFEEDMLIAGMEGYEEYRERVKYKLIPGIY
jgi:protein-S-isoprenylcysteine O-methyltransferase Ste14